MIVKLSQPRSECTDLTVGVPYAVIGIEADELRLLNDHGQPYLYPAEWFEMVDLREPDDWVSERGDDGERYAYPPALNRAGFFEDFFEAEREAVATFWQTVNRHLTTAG